MVKIEWEEVARRGRNHAVLSMDLIARGIAAGAFREFYGEDVGITRWRQFDGARWMDAAGIREYVRKMRANLVNDPEYLLKIAVRSEAVITGLRKEIDRVNKMELDGLENSRILGIFNRVAERYSNLAAACYSYILINKFYPDTITEMVGKREKDPYRQAGIIKRLLAVEREYALKMERESLAKMAKRHLEGNLGSREIAKHAGKFGHMGIYVFYGKPYDEKTLRERIQRLVEKGLEEELKQLEEQKLDVERAKKLEKEWQLTKEEMVRLKTIREWVWTSYYTDEIFSYAAHYARNLWDEIGKRLGLKYEEVIELTYPEIVKGLKEGRKFDVSYKKRIADRYNDSALVAEKGKVILLEGKELDAYYRQEKRAEESYSHIDEVKGMAASPGVARGTVKVLNSINELEKVKKGDVMVAPSTVPAMVPAMEKAAAIVTNEGGLLSHAAIVSREFGKPCIVGTKIATKVFKDGEMVEVDAVKGVVRKVER